jgi:ferredoxin-NADP reductase
MTRTLHDLGDARDVIFVHAARTPADIVFRDELAALARRAPNLRVVHLCEADAPFEAWSGLRGRLSAEKLREIAPDFADREVFVCGPEPFMKSAKDILLLLGHDPKRHHEESFDFAKLAADGTAVEPPPEATAPDVVAVHRVEVARTKRVIECPSNLSILEAARRAGVRLPSSCAKGVCGTCKSKVLSGTFDQDPVGGIRPREVAAGMALLCSSRPTSDLVVDR